MRQVLKTVAEVEKFFEDFGKDFAFDTETTSLSYIDLEIEGISFANESKACYIDLIDNKDIYNIISFLTKVFNNANTIIAHNIVYDMKVLKKYNISLEDKKIYCTMVADHLIDENRSHSLKNLAETILGKEVTKYDEAEKAGHQSQIFYDYAINDAVWTWELCQYQQGFLRGTQAAKLFREVEMPFQHVIVEMETTGMHIDVAKVEEIREQLKKYKDQFIEEMLGLLNKRPTFQVLLTGDIRMESPINFDSSKQLTDILFNQLGLTSVEQTPSGAPSVGKLTISLLKDKHPFVGVLNKYKIVSKLLSAYFEEDAQIMRNLDVDGRVRPSFVDIGTATGRLSCRDPNLQQLPKPNEDLPIPSRSAFDVPKGYKMITADYSGQEIRVMAEISKDPTLVEALNKGYDMHLAIANQFYNLGIPEECLMETHDDYNMWKSKFKNERTRAKTITFGLAYGKGAYGFAKDFDISEEEAQKIVDDYFKGMPKLKQAINDSHKMIEENGYIEYLSGRRRHFEKITNGDWEGYSKKSLRQAFNASIQGFSADMMRMACNNIYKAKKHYKEWDMKIIGTVHDEVIIEVKEEFVEQATQMIKEAMETAVDFCVPTPSDLSIGNNYEEAK